MTVGTLPKNSLAIFAGPGDIEEDELDALLQQHLPDDLAAIIPSRIPRSHKGLQKVLDWFEAQIPDDDEVERTGDVLQYIRELDSTEDVFLILLWGKGDQATHELMQAAAARGILVYDLTDGFDDMTFPDYETDALLAAGRPRRKDTAAPAKADDGPPRETAGTQAPATITDIRELLAGIFEAAAEHLRTSMQTGKADVVDLNARKRAGTAAAAQPKPRTAPVTFKADGTSSASDAARRSWLQNPANPDQYEPKRRGRIPQSHSGWKVVELTAQEEKELGLSRD